VIRFFLFLGFAAFSVKAAEPKKNSQEATIPYLGPGSDKLSPEEYQRVYKSYIQSSILLGYPFLKESAPACEQALSAIFRGAGFFGYPVPNEAERIKRGTKTVGGSKVETYEGAGVILQVARHKENGALDRLVLVNSSSPKAIRRLSGYAKNELLSLEKDPVTNLEKVRGIPVGFPHPFLTSEGQGLFVKTLRFNGKGEGCQPLDFQDNSWVAGFDLGEKRCSDLQADAEKVWQGELSSEDFSASELKRMKELALKSALEKGVKESEAKAIVEKHFQPPFTSEINVVGSAMRNLAQCNLLSLGRAGKPKGAPASSAPTESNKPGASGAGSAQ
jgi:hypothetical protein